MAVREEEDDPQEVEGRGEDYIDGEYTDFFSEGVTALQAGFVHPDVHVSQIGMDLPDDLPYQSWEHVVQRLLQIERGVQWYIGDALNFGERVYGETYAQVVDAVKWSAARLYKVKWVAGAIRYSYRRPTLSFEHHVEVASLMSKAPDVALEILRRAEEEGLDVKEVRYDARQARIDLGLEPDTRAPQAGYIPAGYNNTKDTDLEEEEGEEEEEDVIGNGNRKLMAIDVTDGTRQPKLISPRVAWLDNLLEIVLKLAASDPENCQDVWGDAWEFVEENELSERVESARAKMYEARARSSLQLDKPRGPSQDN